MELLNEDVYATRAYAVGAARAVYPVWRPVVGSLVLILIFCSLLVKFWGSRVSVAVLVFSLRCDLVASDVAMLCLVTVLRMTTAGWHSCWAQYRFLKTFALSLAATL
jgi:hypothetical protein